MLAKLRAPGPKLAQEPEGKLLPEDLQTLQKAGLVAPVDQTQITNGQDLWPGRYAAALLLFTKCLIPLRSTLGRSAGYKRTRRGQITSGGFHNRRNFRTPGL